MSSTQPASPERIVIVGFGPVAARLIEHLLPLVVSGTVALTVIGEEQEVAYNRVLVADVAVGRIGEAGIRLVDSAGLAESGVELRLGLGVERIDRSARTVELSDGSTVGYHRLVLATGAAPVLPPLDGVDRAAALPAGVCFLRTLDDARSMAASLAARKRILILGSGILAVEAALAVADQGGDVILVHHRRMPLERLLGDGAHVLSASLRAAGVRVVAGTPLGVDLSEGRFGGLLLGNGTVIQADSLVLACGVRPRTELAEGAGLAVRDGIVVDHGLCVTGTTDTWAIGDCAEIRCADASCGDCAGTTAPQGLIGPGWQQADQLGLYFVAALTDAPAVAAGPPDRREAVVALKAHGLAAVAAGEASADPWAMDAGHTVAVWADPAHGRYVKMVTRDGVLTGLVCVGMPRTGAELVLLFDRGSELPADRSSLLRLDGAEGTLAASVPGSGPGPEATLCRCVGVARGVVQAAVVDGCASVAEVSASTRAGTGCGGCHEDIRGVVEQFFAPAMAL